MFYLYHFDPTFMLERHPVLARDLRTVLHCRSPVGPGQRLVGGGGGGWGPPEGPGWEFGIWGGLGP